MEVISWLAIAILLPVGIWVARTLGENWMSEKFRTRYSSRIILDAQAWQWKSTDYELQFTLRNDLSSSLQLLGLTATHPEGCKVAWFTHQWEYHPSISHLNSDEITNFHEAKLDVEPGEYKTVSMALRMPKKRFKEVIITGKYVVSGRTKPVILKHKFSLEHAAVPASLLRAR